MPELSQSGDARGELWQSRDSHSHTIAKARVSELAAGQCGRVATYQLPSLQIDRFQVRRWVAGSYLFPRLPRVYGVGHQARSVEADLTEALLYAGPGAML